MSKRINRWTIHITEQFLTSQALGDIRLYTVSSKSYPRVIPGFFVHLSKDYALNNLYGKTLDTFGFKFATMKRQDLLREYVFQRHFDSDDLRKAIFVPLIGRCVQGRTVSRESNNYTMVLSITLNSFPSLFLSLPSMV